jgi:ribosomal protein S18 acetylase RimI-like enzyme
MTLLTAPCHHRLAQAADLAEVITFVQNPDELFYSFPKAAWPLTIGQLAATAAERRDSTLALLDGRPAGFANFLAWQHNASCSLGNLMIAPWARGRGVAQYLIGVMEQQASKHYKAKLLIAACFNSNTAGILLYHKLGYHIRAVQERQDLQGRKVALIEFAKDLSTAEPSVA